MTTNQEGRQAALRDSTSTAYGVAADWHALFDDAGISAGTFNERLLAWINSELSASYSNLVSAMQAYAEDAGYDGWEDMATLVLAMNGAETLLDGETQGLAFDFTDQSALIIDTGTPANNYDSSGTVSSGSLVGPSGKLTYTSPSNKLTLQADGVMRYQAHNLCLQSETSTNATWTKNGVGAADGVADPFGGITAFTITEDGTTGAHRIYQSLTAVLNAQYVNTFYLKQASGDRDLFVRIIGENSDTNASIFDLSAGTSSDTGTAVSTMTAIGNGWYFCTVSAAASVTASTNIYYGLRSSGSNSYAGDSTSGVTICRPHVYRYPANTDYIKTTTAAKYALPIEYDTSGNCLGLLVEEARTNLLTYSNSFDNAAWTKDGSVFPTVTANSIVGVTGVTDMDLITYGGGTGQVFQDVTVSSGATYSYSVFVKAGTVTFVLLQIENGANAARAWFNVSTGAALSTANVGTGVAASSSLTDVGSGIYRCCIVGSIAATTTYRIKVIAVDGDGSTTRPSGTIYAGHAQAEAGSFPTSPIITYGAAATRNADPLSQLTSTFPLSATAGSLYAYVAPYAGADLAGIVSLNDGTGNEEIVIYKDASANIVAQVEDGGVNQLAPLDSTVNASSGTAFKVALAWAANDFALSVDGTAAQTDTGGTLPTVTTLEIGVDQANNYFNGHIKAISYVPRRKTNAELQAETA